jgi:hypothetical protein
MRPSRFGKLIRYLRHGVAAAPFPVAGTDGTRSFPMFLSTPVFDWHRWPIPVLTHVLWVRATECVA